jgi:Kef-type K+ transport system membrane component KefB
MNTWGGNRLLVAAVITEIAALSVFLGIPAVADRLGHDIPPVIGAVIAILAAAAVLGADALDKWHRRTHVHGS